MKEKKNGITLMVLIITIVIMLILAGVTIGAINGGLFEHAREAKTSSEGSANKEEIQRAFVNAYGKSKTGEITLEDLQKELNKIFGGNVAEVFKEGKGFTVRVGDFYYVTDDKGNVENGVTIEPIEYAGDITKGGTCTGTQSKPYRIECIEDLVDFSKRVNTDNQTYTRFANKYILLAKDLDFNSIFSYNDYKAKYSYNAEQNAYIPDENSETTIKELCTTGQGFIPIGNNCPTFFGGIFYGDKPNGERTKLKNVYINRSDKAGLFDNCSAPAFFARIYNIEVDGEITCTGSGAAAGIVCGVTKDYNIEIKNCVNRATVKNTGSGVAVGIMNGTTGGGIETITRCVNYGTISSKTGRAHGIANKATTINKCCNMGTVTATNAPASGIGRR